MLNRIFNLRASLRGDVVQVTSSADTYPIAIAGVVTVYSKAMPAYLFDNAGFFLKLAGATPNVTITCEESPVLPAAANINAADGNYVVGTGVPALATALTSTVAVVATLSIVPMKYCRFKMVGNAGNGSDTTVDLRIFEQELVA